MNTTYYSDGSRGHEFHVGDIVRLKKAKPVYGMHCTNIGKVVRTVPIGTWGKIVSGDGGRHGKAVYGRVMVKLDGYCEPLSAWGWPYHDFFSTWDLEPFGIPADFVPWPDLIAERYERLRQRKENIKYEGWTNVATWMMVLYMDQEPWLIDQIFNLVRKDGTINPGRLVGMSGTRSFPKLDDWIRELRSDENTINWNEIAEHYETKYKEINQTG